MQICVGNKLIIKEPTDDLKCWCRNNLVLDNPEFHKKEKMGVWTGNIPRQIVLYEVVGKDYYLPFGCLNTLWKAYRNKCEFKRLICEFKPFNYKSSINLYPYQEKAVNEAYNARNGVIIAPCGSGKTQMGLELVARLKGRTLWLTHTQDLLNQSMSRAKSVLDADLKSYGTITGGKVNIGEGITFATVQTMSKLDLTEFKNYFDVVIVDECHHAIGSPTKCMQFYKVLSALNCRFKYGLTATPKRNDGLEACMYALLGDICAEVPREAVADTTSPIKVKKIYTEYQPNLGVVLAGDGTIEYSSLVKDIISNDDRFNMVSNVVNSLTEPCLVLANRIDYLERLKAKFEGKSVCLSTLGNSKGAKRMRKQALLDLNEGKIDCVFATYQLAKEGLDCPNLRYVVFATPEKDEITVTQAIGRVGRKADGKEYGTVIDFVDDFGLLKGYEKKRDAIYKKLDYEVV